MTNELAHLLLPRWWKFAFCAEMSGGVDRAGVQIHG